MVSRKSDLIRGYSKGLDLSPQGLRYYEQKGIVHPKRDPDSGYRYYSFSDTLAVTTCRKMRCWGYTLDEAAGMLKEQNFTEQKESLRKHQMQLRKELERQQLNLQRLEEVENTVSDSLEHLEKPQKTKIPNLYFLPTRTEESTIRNRDLLKQINSWNQYQPFPSIVLLNDEKQTIAGLVINREYMKILNLPWQEEIKETSGISISFILTMDEMEKGTYRMFAEKILGKNLNLKRLIIFLLSASMKEEDTKVLCRILIPD